MNKFTILFYLGDDEAYERTAMIDWSKFNLAKQSFQTCETDGEEGLTWDEVDACEVRACNIPSSACSQDLRPRDLFFYFTNISTFLR